MDIQRRRKRVCATIILQILAEEYTLQNYAVLKSTTGILPILSSTFRREEVPRVRNFIEDTVQRYDDLDFKFHFRLDRSTADILVNYLGNSNIPTPETCLGGTAALSLKKQLLMFLWFIGNMESFRAMADRFGVSQSTYHAVIRRIADAITTDVTPRVITWPNSDAKRQLIAEGFRRIGRLPNTIGAVDGTHIRITAPREHPQSYFNRKHFYSMQLQGVCTSRLLFTHVSTGWPGSVHDARVFRNSSLMEDGKFALEYYLIGDSAYPLSQFLLTPFRDNGNIGFQQRRFNQELSRQRNVIERAFGHLKGRFLRLQFFRVEDIKLLCKVILAACTLHNVCIQNNDELMEEFQEGQGREDVFPYNEEVTGQERRNEIMAMLN